MTDNLLVPSQTPSSLGSFQAQRANDAPIGNSEYELAPHSFLASVYPNDPDLHRQIVLPGAKRAVTEDVLRDAQARGITPEQIVDSITADFDRANAKREVEFKEWRDGDRLRMIEAARLLEQQRNAAYARALADIQAQ